MSYLVHHGIKGQRWGIIRTPDQLGHKPTGADFHGNPEKHRKQVTKQAQKDAREYITAENYHGDGAGNRRKDIRSRVNERSKDPDYKKAFDDALANEDTNKAVDRAHRQRTAEDVKTATVKTGKGLLNLTMHNPVAVASSALAVMAILRVTGLDKKMVSAGKSAVAASGNLMKTGFDKIKDLASAPGRAAQHARNMKQAFGNYGIR